MQKRVEDTQRAVPCWLTVWSEEAHLSQVYTGLSMLHEAGRINLRQRFTPPPPPDAGAPHHLRTVRMWHAQIDLEGHRYYIDTHDGPEILDVECDVYLKRSFHRDFVPAHMKHKVRPLGLNYEVYRDEFDRFELRRRMAVTGVIPAIRYIASKITGRNGRISVSEVTGHGIPRPAEPKVLFMCRTWDTNEPGRTADKNAERQFINEMRAACLRALRKEFGPRFTGGFEPSAHAKQHYPDLLVPATLLTDRRNYLKIVREHEICIATMGLHGSNGWKLGEYVAQGAAIVSERLVHEVPQFREDLNYVSFSTPEECVRAVGRLLENKTLRRRMVFANTHYYENWLRPDSMMSKALADAFTPLEIQPAVDDPATAPHYKSAPVAPPALADEEPEVSVRPMSRPR